MTDPKGPEVGLRALFRLVEACEALEPLDPEAELAPCETEELRDEIDRIRALATAVRLGILNKAPAGLD